MRALVALGLLVPLALAQPEVIDWIDAEIAPFEELVVPLQGPKSTTMTTRVSCLFGEPIVGIPITYLIVEQPSWSSVMIDPVSAVAPMGQCAEGYAEAQEAQISVAATDQAPGFAPTPLVVEITAGTGEREQKERVSVNVSASFFSVLDVQAAEAIVVIPPGASHDFNVVVTNFGNARTKVEAAVIDHSNTITVTVPPPLVLGSRQHGDSDILGTLSIRATSTEQGRFVNSVAVANVRINSYYAEDDAYVGDSTNIAFLVTVRSGAAAAAEKSPVDSIALPLVLAALAIVAALARGRR